MPLQTVVDDSGCDGQGPVMLMAGIIGRAEEMASFADQWRVALDAHPRRIGTFKMREAVACTHDWHGLTTDERDNKVRDLASVLNRFAFRAVYVCVELAAYAEIVRTTQPPPLDKPYVLVYQGIIAAAYAEIVSGGETEPFDIIFDEHKSLGPRAREAYPVVRSGLDPSGTLILPLDPVFRNDETFLPLQAADMMAWSYREVAVSRSHPLPWLRDALGNIKTSQFSMYWGREELRELVSMSYEKLSADKMAELHRQLRHQK